MWKIVTPALAVMFISNFACAQDIAEKRELVVGAGETFRLTKGDTQFSTVTVHNGGEIIFDGIIRVVTKEYIRDNKDISDGELISGKPILKRVCADNSDIMVIYADSFVDHTSEGAFNVSTYRQMTYDEYKTCAKITGVSQIVFVESPS